MRQDTTSVEIPFGKTEQPPELHKYFALIVLLKINNSTSLFVFLNRTRKATYHPCLMIPSRSIIPSGMDMKANHSQR